MTAPVVPIRELGRHVGQTVNVQGWLYNKRSSGKLLFLEVRDGTGIAQGVMAKKEVGEELFKTFDRLPQESAIIVTGTVKAEPRAVGGFELSPVSGGQVVSTAREGYPISLQAHGIAHLMEHRHLSMRHRKPGAVLRIRAAVVRAIRDFFDSRGFLLVDSPILTPSACEGTTTLFEVDYFEDKAYLTQSGQLYAEAGAMAFGKVYCFGPTFRAEKSKTRRHLTEFWMVEPEMAYASLDDVMDLAEDFLCHVVQRALEQCGEELKVLERDPKPLESVRKPFPRVQYDDAVKMLQEMGHPFPWGGDFGAPDETALSAKFDRPVMVHRYPAAVKAFYMKRDPQDDRLAMCVDVLAPEGVGEIIGGGQRADDLEFIEKQIELHKLPKEAFEWYLDLRRYGSVPHGGFGLGVERTVAWISGTEHVRETIPFPRLLHKIYP